jgi:error-prone DNA polymerase
VYVELHAASAFSFLRGASLPETLIERAAALGYSALALLDADGVYGAPRFHKAAKQAGLRAIVGAELTMTPYDPRQIPNPKSQIPNRKIANRQSPINHESRITNHKWALPVLVSSADGYRNLCRLVTRMKMRAAKGDGALALEELEGFTGGLVALAGRPALDAQHYGVGGLLDRLVGLFGRGNVCVELQRHLLRDEESDNAALTGLARAFRVPVIATNGVRFADIANRPLYDVLTCVYHHTTIDQAGRRLARNAERYLKSPEAMAQLFADRPDALAGTARSA